MARLRGRTQFSGKWSGSDTSPRSLFVQHRWSRPQKSSSSQSHRRQRSVSVEELGLSPKARRFVEEALAAHPQRRTDANGIIHAIDQYQEQLSNRLSRINISEDEAADLGNDLQYITAIKMDIRKRIESIRTRRGILGAYDVALVKGMLRKGYPQHKIAKYFDVNPGRISEIYHGRRFASIPPEAEDRLPIPRGHQAS